MKNEEIYNIYGHTYLLFNYINEKKFGMVETSHQGRQLFFVLRNVLSSFSIPFIIIIESTGDFKHPRPQSHF